MSLYAKGKITWEDYKQYNIVHLKESFKKKKVIVPLIVFLFCILLLIFFDVSDFTSGKKEFIGSITYYAIFISFTLYIALIWRIPKSWKKVYESNKLIGNEQELFIDKNSIRQVNANGLIEVNKDKIHHIVIDKKYIYAYIAQNQAILIPASFFQENEFERVVELIQANYI